LRLPLETIEVPSDLKIRYTPRVLEQTFESIILPRTISVLHGSERAPLSILAHSIAVSAAKSLDDAQCVFLDSGTNYSPSLVRAISPNSGVQERILVGNVMSLSDIVEMMSNLREFSNVSLIVLDSLTGALNLTGAPGTKGRQRELFSTLESLRLAANQFDTHVLITDHSSRNWSTGEMAPIGGNVLSHAVDSVVRTNRLREGENLVRIHVERCTALKKPPGIIVRADWKGIRSMR
jgi:predicted ATP-dependent serine protease